MSFTKARSRAKGGINYLFRMNPHPGKILDEESERVRAIDGVSLSRSDYPRETRGQTQSEANVPLREWP